MKRSVRVLVLLALAATIGCRLDKTSNPLSPTVAGPIPGVNISAPKLLEPGTGWRLDSTVQPLTLLLENSSTNGVRPLSYTFEVASDATFNTRLFTRSGVVPGDDGRTSLRLPDRLTGGRSYYWRAQASDGVNSSPFSQPVAFELFIPIVIGQPVPVAPVGNAVVSNQRPRFTFANAPKSGPAGVLTYTIEIATDAGFGRRVAVWLVTEQSNITSLDAPVNLDPSTRYFWRVLGSDLGGAQGSWSATQSFQTPLPPPPPTTPTPGPGTSAPGTSCASAGSALGIVQCRRSQYGTPMSSSQLVSLLRGVATDLNAARIAPGSFGLLRKTGGFNCQGFSCDIICSGQGDGQQQFDVLSDSDFTAGATWSGPHTMPHIRVDACIAP
jgi:hypothetical protein